MKKSELRQIIKEELKKLTEWEANPMPKAERLKAHDAKKVAKKMQKIEVMRAFAPKVAAMKTINYDTLNDMMPDYVAGWHITNVLKEGIQQDLMAQRNMFREYENSRTRGYIRSSESNTSTNLNEEELNLLGNTYKVGSNIIKLPDGKYISWELVRLLYVYGRQKGYTR